LLVYFGLIPTLRLVDMKKLISEFKTRYDQSYLLTEIAENDDKLSAALTFTDTKLQEFEDVWKQRKGSLEGVDSIAKEMKKKHLVEVYCHGIMRIVLKEPDKTNVEFMKGEMKEVYDDILLCAIDVSSQLGYSLATEEENLVGGISAIGEDTDIDSLSDELDRRLEIAHRAISRTILTEVNDVERQIDSSWMALIRRKGYRSLLSLRSLVSQSGTLFSVMSNCIDRVLVHISEKFKTAWEIASSHSRMVLGLVSTILGEIEFILNVYSDHLGVVGVYVNIVVLGVGLLFSPLGKEIGYPEGLTILAGFFALFSGSLFWKRTGTKDLILNALRTIVGHSTIGI